MRPWRASALLAGLLAGLLAAAYLLAANAPDQAQAHDTSSLFVMRSGAALTLGGQPYRFTGVNMYNANSDGWCRGALTDSEFGQALDDIGLGGDEHGVLRAWFFQTLATTYPGGARDWTRFDRTLQIARSHGYKVLVTLSDQWGECGTKVTPTYSFKSEGWYTSGYASPDPSMLAGYGIWLSYRAWVAEMVNRYRNDPTILAWQLINEAEVNPGGAFGVCPPGDVPRDELIAWAGDVSNLVRSIDPNHLISLGTIGGGQCGSQGSQYQDVHALPNIDLCEYHDYSPAMAMPGDQWNGLGVRVQQCAALNKPLFVGEVGIDPSQVGGTLAGRAAALRAKLLAQSAVGIDGHLVWDYSKDGSTVDNFDIGPGDPALAVLREGPYLIVNSANDIDDGSCDPAHCSLREAVRESNADAGLDTIGFSIPGPGPHVISPIVPLQIANPAIVDGTTQSGYIGTPQVVLDGSAGAPPPGATPGPFGEPWIGLWVQGSDVTVRGLRITHFGGPGILALGERAHIEANVIDHNGTDGIIVADPARHASISGNSISDNGGIGIDIGDDGASPPTVGGPVGPVPPYEVLRQNAPILEASDPVSGSITGSLGSRPGFYRLEFFSNLSCDPSGFGEGAQLVGSTNLTLPGAGSFTTEPFTFAVPGGVSPSVTYTATATNPDGTTSEFSSCVPFASATPTGTGVVVHPPDAGGGSAAMTLTFESVTAAGDTAFTSTATGPNVPAGFQLGSPATYYDIETTATFSGSVQVCIQFSGIGFSDPSNLRLLHYDSASATWIDVTTSLDSGTQTICGATSSFSPFAIVQRNYAFAGFSSPVDALPIVNVAKAGSAIPVKFRLFAGDMGLSIFAQSHPSSVRVACDTQADQSVVEETVGATASSLKYDPATGLYNYVWKTDKTWANTCRRLVLKFRDGTEARALFKFKR